MEAMTFIGACLGLGFERGSHLRGLGLGHDLRSLGAGLVANRALLPIACTEGRRRCGQEQDQLCFLHESSPFLIWRALCMPNADPVAGPGLRWRARIDRIRKRRLPSCSLE